MRKRAELGVQERAQELAVLVLEAQELAAQAPELAAQAPAAQPVVQVALVQESA